MSFIEMNNVTFGYEGLPVLKSLSLSVEKNSFWAVVGPNGSGKSTFLNLLCGQLKPDEGKVHVDGRAASSYSSQQLARILSMVRQEFVPVFGFSVRQTVMMARFYRTSSLFENAEDIEAVDAALAATDTMNFADRPLGHLSGGERQRVFIARSLAQETPVLLLDEPTSHLDLKHQIRIFDLLKQMQHEQGKTILLVTHDLNMAVQYCDRVLLLGAEGAFFQGLPEQVLESGQIQSIFGVQGHQGQLQERKFFIPLGRFSMDRPEKST
ncbi:MAG: ABC transporter ATP-binding protein [Phycisphaerae bacterium]|nr:ABC transporter ATP-binding protein [Phycisphaerae bacterium]